MLILTVFLLCTLGCEKLLNDRRDYYYKQGIQLYESGEYKDALDQFDNAVAFDNKFTDAKYMKAMCYFKLNNYESARDLFRIVFRERPEIKSGLKLVESCFKSHKYGQAASEADAMLEDYFPNSDELVLWRARSALELGSLKFRTMVYDDLKDRIRKGSFYKGFHAVFAHLLIFRGRTDEAEKILKQKKTGGLDWVKAMRFLAESVKDDDIQKAIELYKVIIETVADPFDIQLEYAGMLRDAGKQTAEEMLLQNMLEKHPANKQIVGRLFDFYMYYGRYDAAQEFIRNVLAENPDNLELKEKLIDVYIRNKEYKQAAKKARDFLRQADNSPVFNKRIKIMMADMYFEQGRIEKARRIAEEIKADDLKNIKARFILSKIHLREGRNLLAVSGFRHLAFENNQRPDFPYYLGLALLERENESLAVNAFQDALDRDPKYKPALMDLADIFVRKKYYDELRKRIAEYLKINPDDDEVRELLDTITFKRESAMD